MTEALIHTLRGQHEIHDARRRGYEAEIATLEGKRDMEFVAMDALRFAINAAGRHATQPVETPLSIRNEPPAERKPRITLGEKIMAWRGDSPAAFTIEDVVAQFPTTGLVTLKNALAKLVKTKHLTLDGHLYRLPSDKVPAPTGTGAHADAAMHQTTA